MLIDSTGWVQSYRIYESVIRSRARLVYDDVAEFLIPVKLEQSETKKFSTT